VRQARRSAATGDGPTFLEALTYRYEGHNTGQVINYRTQDELDDWRASKDPIHRLEQALVAAGRLAPGDGEEFAETARQTVDDAIEFSESSPWPDAREVAAGVTATELNVGAHRCTMS
jgi:pyruvate dehydrogenase E1 component alpha subunit